VAANSRGFVGGYPFSRHTISVAPIAGKGANMQRDDWYSSMRDPKQLARPEAIGRYAAERALARLNACKLTTRKCPVLFEAPLAAGLLGAFVQAVSGGALYRKSTFLLDSLGQQVFPDHIQVREDPHVIGGVGSAPFDEERRQDAATRCGQRRRGAGLLPVDLFGAQAGHGNHRQFGWFAQSVADLVADYCRRYLQGHAQENGYRPAGDRIDGTGRELRDRRLFAWRSGYWVEKGVIQYPVEEITIAGNMKEMLRQIVAIGNDTLIRGTKETGSILLENMTIAGD